MTCLLLLFIALCTISVKSYELIRFGGAGIYFWWQAGAASYIAEKYHTRSTALVGASAGSIAAALMVSNASFYDAAKLAIRQVEERDLWSRKEGLATVWGPIVREFLVEIVPNNLEKEDLSRVHICVTPRALVKGTRIESNFADKAELVDAVMASVHIPIFMDGKIWSTFKGKKYIDGSFWSFVTRRKIPVPKHLRHVPVLDIDYLDDTVFLSSLKSRNFVKLIKPDGLFEMMDYGYQYMEQQDRTGRLSSLVNR
eukprot:gene1659-1812_t